MCQSEMPYKKIVIGILSAQNYDERRTRCRKTWAVTSDDIEALFLIGDPNRSKTTLEDDVLKLPCPDDYDSLPQKVRLFCEWALSNRAFKFLFKCDDDTFVSTERLLNHEFHGNYIGRSRNNRFAYGGPGYLLSPHSAEIVAKKLTMIEGHEDVLVGSVLRKNGIKLTKCQAFGFPPRYKKLPAPENDIITTHPVRGDLMYKLWTSLNETSSQDVFGNQSPKTYPKEINSLLTIIDAKVAYGEIGLNGELGHRVDGSSHLKLPSSTPRNVHESCLISAHAPSTISILTNTACNITGYMDLASWEWKGRPTIFQIDNKVIGSLEKPGEKTDVHPIEPGRHVLSTTCDDQITRRYPIWSISAKNTQVEVKASVKKEEDTITFAKLGKRVGTGNQLFQYALLLAVAAKNNYQIVIPDGTLRGFTLTCKQLPRKNLKTQRYFYREGILPFSYDPKVFEQPAGTDFQGYFQSYLYFEAYEKLVRKELSFEEGIRNKAAKFISNFRARQDGELVFVSARRGNYVNSKNLHIPFTANYFNETRQYFPPNAKYLVTSNDLTWAKNNLNFHDVYFITDDDPIVCMAIGTMCDHHICSAGTYSWWTAWLCPNPDKLVVIPSPWYNPASAFPENANKMSPPEWIRHQLMIFHDI